MSLIRACCTNAILAYSVILSTAKNLMNSNTSRPFASLRVTNREVCATGS